jgi:hypothetical protein
VEDVGRVCEEVGKDDGWGYIKEGMALGNGLERMRFLD